MTISEILTTDNQCLDALQGRRLSHRVGMTENGTARLHSFLSYGSVVYVHRSTSLCMQHKEEKKRIHKEIQDGKKFLENINDSNEVAYHYSFIWYKNLYRTQKINQEYI